MSICRFQFKARGKQYVLASEHDEEVARLKAEVERLTKAEVERLRKEGEAMYPNLGPGWSHNAKEGKQP